MLDLTEKYLRQSEQWKGIGFRVVDGARSRRNANWRSPFAIGVAGSLTG